MEKEENKERREIEREEEEACGGERGRLTVVMAVAMVVVQGHG